MLGARRLDVADPVADLDVGEAPQFCDRAGRDHGTLNGEALLEHGDRGDLLLGPTTDPHPIARPDRPGEHPHVRNLLAGGASLDLEDGSADGAFRITGGRRQELGDTRHQLTHAGAGDRRSEEHGVQQTTRALGGEDVSKPAIRQAGLVVDVGGHDLVVPLRERLGEAAAEGVVVGTKDAERCVACAEPARRPHRDDLGREAVADREEHTCCVRADSVDLVQEDQRRDAEPLERAHQDACLRLHPLDGRDHEDRTVEHAQDTVYLGDEVGMSRCVDQVHVHVADSERRDGRPDRDPAPAFERERVGLRRSSVDASGLVDHPGLEQKPFGERRLTGVYMRQDPKVELLLRHASYPPNRSQRPFGWT